LQLRDKAKSCNAITQAVENNIILAINEESNQYDTPASIENRNDAPATSEVCDIKEKKIRNRKNPT